MSDLAIRLSEAEASVDRLTAQLRAKEEAMDELMQDSLSDLKESREMAQERNALAIQNADLLAEKEAWIEEQLRYETQKRELESEIGTLRTNLSAASSRLSEQDSKISQLCNEKRDLEEELAALEGKLNKLESIIGQAQRLKEEAFGAVPSGSDEPRSPKPVSRRRSKQLISSTRDESSRGAPQHAATETSVAATKEETDILSRASPVQQTILSLLILLLSLHFLNFYIRQ